MKKVMYKRNLYIDFDIFSRALMGSGDHDPVYPFIKGTLKLFPFEPEWFCFAYTTFYSLESAMIFCREFPNQENYQSARFFDMRHEKIISKMGHERRGSQRNMLNQDKIFREFIEARDNWGLDYGTNDCFRRSLSENVSFHGAWASYKVAEVFEKAIDYTSLSIPDLGLEGKDVNSNDGPIGGLRWLYGRDNVYDNWMIKHWNNFGRKLAKGWGCCMGEVETCLCKFHKIISGNYYIGHDIDELNELRPTWGDMAFEEIMGNNFDQCFWKEVHGIRKELKSQYKIGMGMVNSDFAMKSKYKKVDVLETILNI